MATFAEIREAVKTIVEAGIPTLKVHPRIPGGTTGHAMVVKPAEDTEFDVTMGRGFDTWQISLEIVIPVGDLGVAQSHLDSYVDGGGANSVRKVIFDSRTLGLANTDAHVARIASYGPMENAGFDNVSATLRLVVHTKPS